MVPGYYHRYDPITGNVAQSTCCENTATEHRMMEKLMIDSLVVWAEHYKFDAFRFDLMGHIPKDAILRAREAVQAVDPDNYFYGEGWDFGEVAGDRLFEQATQKNMAYTDVGTFNDQIREAVRGAALFSGNTSPGTLVVQDKLRMSLAGTLLDYPLLNANNAYVPASTLGGYAGDPADIINYVSKHDNETLWDQLNYTLPANISITIECARKISRKGSRYSAKVFLSCNWAATFYAQNPWIAIPMMRATGLTASISAYKAITGTSAYLRWAKTALALMRLSRCSAMPIAPRR